MLNSGIQAAPAIQAWSGSTDAIHPSIRPPAASAELPTGMDLFVIDQPNGTGEGAAAEDAVEAAERCLDG